MLTLDFQLAHQSGGQDILLLVFDILETQGALFYRLVLHTLAAESVAALVQSHWLEHELKADLAAEVFGVRALHELEGLFLNLLHCRHRLVNNYWLLVPTPKKIHDQI